MSVKKYGHWRDSHRQNGSLPKHIPAFDTAEQFAAHTGQKTTDNQNSNDCTNGSRNSSPKSKTLIFNNAQILQNHDVCICDAGLNEHECINANSVDICTDNVAHPNYTPLGSLVDDGAPYSAIEKTELQVLMEKCGNEINTRLDKIPSCLNGTTHWQYGSGMHASAKRPIIGSFMINARTDNGNIVKIRHLVLQGLSQWVIGKNVTDHSDILHRTRNSLKLGPENYPDYISLVNSSRLCYIPLSVFMDQHKIASALSSMNGNLLQRKSWSEIEAIVDKVHKHICGHAIYTDIKLLFDRNGIWNDAVEKYVSDVMSRCSSCRSSAPPQPSRKVSISSLSREFNNTVAVDHFYLENIRVMHCMDTVTRYSAACIVPTASLDDAVLAF